MKKKPFSTSINFERIKILFFWGMSVLFTFACQTHCHSVFGLDMLWNVRLSFDWDSNFYQNIFGFALPESPTKLTQFRLWHRSIVHKFLLLLLFATAKGKSFTACLYFTFVVRHRDFSSCTAQTFWCIILCFSLGLVFLHTRHMEKLLQTNFTYYLL